MTQNVEFFQGYTIDGCPYALSIIGDGTSGVASGTIHTTDGRRIKLPNLTAEQGSYLSETLPRCNITEVVSEIERLSSN